MRKLPFLLVLLLLSLLLLAAAASAHAFSLPAAPVTTNLVLEAESEEEGEDESAEEADEGEEAESSEADEEGEDCGPEEDAACEDQGEAGAGAECLLEDASASLAVVPEADQVRLTIHYDASEPTPVVLDSRLHGSKGSLRLGSDRARFHRTGTYRDSFELAAKQMPKALAAREFEVDLHAVGTPADCALKLASRAPHRAR